MPVPHPDTPRLLLAPMDGLLDARLRAVVSRVGGYDWGVTEFVRVTGEVLPARVFLHRVPELGSGSRTPSGLPMWVQLLGSDPGLLAANAARLATLGPAGIDLNFGCPAPTVNRHRGGAVLLEEPELLSRIVREIRSALDPGVALSAKMRLGVSDKGRALEAAQALAEGGAAHLVVHARTRDERYRPPAHWAWVARIAEAVQVPVIANGEVWTLNDYLRCRAESGRRDVMLGRGALADPFLPARIRAHLAGEEFAPAAGAWARVLPLVESYWQDVRVSVGVRHAPGRLKQWLKMLQPGYPEAARLFATLRTLRGVEEIDSVLAQSDPIRAAA